MRIKATTIDYNPEATKKSKNAQIFRARKEAFSYSSEGLLNFAAEVAAEVAAGLRNNVANPKPVGAPAEPTDVTATTATLNGNVDPLTEETTVTFRYGVYGSGSTTDATAAESPVAGSAGPTAVSAAVTSLTPDTYYEYRLRIQNASGLQTTEPVIFKTLAT